jgi:hypothetical protein
MNRFAIVAIRPSNTCIGRRSNRPAIRPGSSLVLSAGLSVSRDRGDSQRSIAWSNCHRIVPRRQCTERSGVFPPGRSTDRGARCRPAARHPLGSNLCAATA